MARWLRYWLTLAEPHLRPSTLHGYRDHIDRYLIPSIGRITLADLTGRRLQACFDLLARQRTRNGTVIAASTVDRVRATLRSALNAARTFAASAGEGLAHGADARRVLGAVVVDHVIDEACQQVISRGDVAAGRLAQPRGAGCAPAR